VGAGRDVDRARELAFGLAGEALPFEDTERYTARRRSDRFMPETLLAYLAALGLFLPLRRRLLHGG
jgi:hypothetical protein